MIKTYDFVIQEYNNRFINKKLFIFDMDDTVVLTEDLNFSLYKDSIEKVTGIRLKRSEWNRIFSGRKPQYSLPEFLEIKKKDFHTGKLVDNIIKILKKNKLNALKKFKPEIVAGIDVFLFSLKKVGLTTVLVTSTKELFTNIILTNAGLIDFFDFIYTGDNNPYCKPDPNVYLNIIQKLKYEMSEGIVFEDSYSGVMAALRAGVDVIKVGNKEFKLNCKQINDYSEILKI